MSKRMYDGGSLQGFNVVSQLYPSSADGRGFEGRGFYEGVVCRGCIGIPEEIAGDVIGYVGIGVDIDSECDGVIVDQVLMEWRKVVGALNEMEGVAG